MTNNTWVPVSLHSPDPESVVPAVQQLPDESPADFHANMVIIAKAQVEVAQKALVKHVVEHGVYAILRRWPFADRVRLSVNPYGSFVWAVDTENGRDLLDELDAEVALVDPQQFAYYHEYAQGYTEPSAVAPGIEFRDGRIAAVTLDLAKFTGH